jgi:AcrR family transcriptional regulator
MNKSETQSKPRGRPRGYDRDKALDAAMRLFWARGFEATSVHDLTQAMGVTPPSLYSAFGDKKRLFLEAVDRYQAISGPAVQAALTTEPTAQGAVHGLMLAAVDTFAGARTPKGCLVVLGAANCAEESTDVADALAARRLAGVQAVRARLAAGEAAGELAEGTDIDALVDLVTATVFGLALKARDGVSRKALKATVEQFIRMWPARRPQP